MSDQGRPKLREQLICRDIEGTFAIYDRLQDRTTLLNTTAAAVLERCDGTMSMAEITAELALQYHGDEAQIQADVERAVRDFAARGLLVSADF